MRKLMFRKTKYLFQGLIVGQREKQNEALVAISLVPCCLSFRAMMPREFL
jgi:hypothetical protein